MHLVLADTLATVAIRSCPGPTHLKADFPCSTSQSDTYNFQARQLAKYLGAVSSCLRRTRQEIPYRSPAVFEVLDSNQSIPNNLSPCIFRISHVVDIGNRHYVELGLANTLFATFLCFGIAPI